MRERQGGSARMFARAGRIMSEAGTRGQSLLSLLVSLVALSLVVGVGLASGGKIDSSGDDGWVTGPAVKRELAQIERQRAYRASRQGIDERAASQSAYRGLDDRAALRLMRHAVGRLFRDDGSRLPLRQGARVARFARDPSA